MISYCLLNNVQIPYLMSNSQISFPDIQSLCLPQLLFQLIHLKSGKLVSLESPAHTELISPHAFVSACPSAMDCLFLSIPTHTAGPNSFWPTCSSPQTSSCLLSMLLVLGNVGGGVRGKYFIRTGSFTWHLSLGAKVWLFLFLILQVGLCYGPSLPLLCLPVYQIGPAESLQLDVSSS